MARNLNWTLASVIRWLFDSQRGWQTAFFHAGFLLRALGLIITQPFFSSFSDPRTHRPQGILPAKESWRRLAGSVSHFRFWYTPSLLWISTAAHAIGPLLGGMLAALLSR